MNQQTSPTPSELVFTTRKCQHRAWMNGTTFSMKGKNYKILSGGWIGMKDSIIFQEVGKEGTFNMPETEFFDKVDKTKLKGL